MKRRVIRLHPMLVFSAVNGLAWFYFGAVDRAWPPLHSVMLAVVLQCLLIPCPHRLDIRGLQQMFPLNGSIWSLFWEYIGSVLYGLVFRKLSYTVLKLSVGISLLITVLYGLNINTPITLHGPTIPAYEFDSGYRNDYYQQLGACIRLLFPFLLGILLSRNRTFIRIKHGQIICPLAMLVLLSVPAIGNVSGVLNSVYETVCVTLLFPTLLVVGAGSSVDESYRSVLRFIGDVSYPLYTIHRTVAYAVIGWKYNSKNIPPSGHFCAVVSMLMLSFGIAYSALKLYDEPIRRFLKEKLRGKDTFN